MVKGRKSIPIKQYSVWLILLMKRLWKQPVYIGLVLLIPLLGYAVGILEQDEMEGAVAAVYVEEGGWGRQIADGLREAESDSVLHFVFCEDESEVERRVLKADADCGFVIPADLKSRMMDNDWRRMITVYETSGSSITGIARERIGGVIFQLYSEQRYKEYMEETAQRIEDSADRKDGNMAEFAQDAYERHLADGSTFAFRYRSNDQYSQTVSDTGVQTDGTVFPVKGVFAVVIFISGMCGMLDYDKDVQEKRFVRIMPNLLTYAVDVWMPTVFLSIAVVICLWISDGIRSCGTDITIGRMLSAWDPFMWGRQIGELLVYQCVIVFYCGILGQVLRRQETIAAAIPVLALGSLVCSPVFIRLAVYLPVFAILEKMFPATYYLLM